MPENISLPRQDDVQITGDSADSQAALRRLFGLEHDTAAACLAGVARLSDGPSRNQLLAFIEDHYQRAADLTPHLAALDENVFPARKPISVFTESDIKLAALLGDAAVLKVLVEKQYKLVSAYRRALELGNASPVVVEKLRAGETSAQQRINGLQHRSPAISSY